MSYWMIKEAFRSEWFINNRKKLLVHGLILLVFVLYCFFLAEPLSDRLNRIEGEAGLHAIALPDAISNFQYSMDVIHVDSDTMDLNGWASIKGNNTEAGQIFIVLKSDSSTYVFDTVRFTIKTVVGQIEDNRMPEASFFQSILPLRNVKSGNYAIGIYIKKDNMEALQYMDKVLVKTKNNVQVSVWISKCQEIELSDDSGNMQFHIDEISDLNAGEKQLVVIEGWAFIKGQNTRNNRIDVILKSDTNKYVFDTMTKYTPWVPDHLGITDMGLDWAGFIARIPQDEIKAGTYKVGVYIKKGDIAAFQYTNRSVTF